MIRSSAILLSIVMMSSACIASQVAMIAGGEGTTGTQPPPDSFTTFLDSDYNMVAFASTRIPTWYPRDDLPLDTSGYSTTTTLCDWTDLKTEAEAATANTIVTVPASCTITAPENNTINLTTSNVVVRFPSTSSIALGTSDPLSAPGGRGLRHQVFSIGVTPSLGTAISWTAGYGLGNRTITLASVSGLSVGDYGYLETDDFAGWNAGMVSRQGVKLTCVGTTGSDSCSGLASNQVKVEHNLYMDFSGASYGTVGTTTGRQFVPITSISRNIGIENITITNAEPEGTRDYTHTIRVNGCVDCWVTGNDIQPGGNSALNLTDRAIGTVVRGNKLRGPLHSNACLTDVFSVQATNPVTIDVYTTNQTAASPTDCSGQYSDTTNNSSVYLSGTVMTEINGKQFQRSAPIGGEGCTPCVRLQLIGEDGTGRSGGPSSGWSALFNNWNIGIAYLNAGNTETVFEKNAMIEIPGGPVLQGTIGSILGYNYQTRSLSGQCQRGMFLHGQASVGNLIEGNDLNCAIFITDNVRPTDGPHNMFYHNRLRDQGGEGTDVLADVNKRGSFTWENRGTSLQYEYVSILGNWFRDTKESFGFPYMDYDGGTPPFTKDMWIERNVIHDGTLKLEDSPPNSTTTNDTNVEAEEAPSGWSTFNGGDSAYRTAVPPWWCQESGTFPSIGAEVDSTLSALSTLPAEILSVDGTCTP